MVPLYEKLLSVWRVRWITRVEKLLRVEAQGVYDNTFDFHSTTDNGVSTLPFIILYTALCLLLLLLCRHCYNTT
jgi:hypothetical protein